MRRPQLESCNVRYAVYFMTYKHDGLVGYDPHFSHSDSGNIRSTDKKRF